MIKKCFFLLFIILMSLEVYSQKTAHAVFLGLSLGGDRQEFVDSLEERGYEIDVEDHLYTSFTGLFDGVGVIIEVHATPISQIVHQVSVSFVEFQENEFARWLKFSEIKKKLKKKYGSWRHTREKGLDEWSSSYARVSLGTTRLPGNSYKTLFVWWQDRSGWEALQMETVSLEK